MSKKGSAQPPGRAEVAEFLTAFKLAIEYERCQFIGRPRTDQDLIDLNQTRQLAMDVIRGLTPDNYSAGPAPDDTDSGKKVWVFGCHIEGTEVYIKLRLNPTKRGEMPRGSIWSFHKAEHRMRYPLRGGA
jgi:hypothetical protein